MTQLIPLSVSPLSFSHDLSVYTATSHSHKSAIHRQIVELKALQHDFDVTELTVVCVHAQHKSLEPVCACMRLHYCMYKSLFLSARSRALVPTVY